MGEIISNYATGRGVLIHGIYKELNKFHNHKAMNIVKNWAKDMKRQFSEDNIQMDNRHMK